MQRLDASSTIFESVRKGLAWAAGDLPGGRVEGGLIRCGTAPVALVFDETFAHNDGYRISAAPGSFTVAAARPLGFFSGSLNLARRLRQGVRRGAETVNPRFKSRLYKHEANITGPAKGHTWVGDLDEDFWVAYAKALVRNHFTGLVFYAGYHPFEYFLDYDAFPEAAPVPARRRRRTLLGLKRAFGVARAFGLKTFMQHYVTHYTAGLAGRHDIGFGKTRAGSRLSALDHPVVDEYSRYVYRRTFELLPELTGFYLNFESAPNSGAFVKRNLYPEAIRAGARPEFIFRLWDFNSPLAIKDLIESYPGVTRLAHKIQDRADYYYYPKADPRVIEWKRFFPDTEFLFLLGPCHNCGTVQSRQLWADNGFVRALLADAENKGADSFAFHTVYELLAPEIPARRIAGEHEIHMAHLNRGHLDAAIDYVRGESPSKAVLVKRLGERLATSGRRAAPAFRAIREASQITLTTFGQYWHSTSEEGYLYPAIRSYYQDPFLHLTPSFVNDEPTSAVTITTAWLNRKLKMRNVPDDAQLVIDYVNREKEKAPRTPPMIARELESHCEKALSFAKKAAGARPSAVMATLVTEARRMYNFGMRPCREMRAALNLYEVFFSGSRAKTVGKLKKALEELKAVRPHIKKGDPLAARNHLWWHETQTEKDIRDLRALVRRIEGGGFPYAAFAAFAGSLERYNEIRRTVRPNKRIRPRDERLIKVRLMESISRAKEAVELLAKQEYRRPRRNVEGWLRFVRSELAGVRRPTCEVPLESRIGADDGFVPLVHDDCFRYGENCIDDLLGFFRPTAWRMPWDVRMRIVRARDGLVLSLAERGVNVAARRKRWREFAGTRSETFFWRFYVDRECTGREMDIWCIAPEGRSLLKGGYRIFSRQDAVLETGRPVEGGKAEFTRGRDWWRLDYTLPWRLLGGRAKPGEKWRVNVTTTPRSGTPILPRAGIEGRNQQFIWCPAWEMTAANDFLAGKPERTGTIVFA